MSIVWITALIITAAKAALGINLNAGARRINAIRTTEPIRKQKYRVYFFIRC